MNNFNNMIAFVNPKSGGQKGQRVYNELKKYLPRGNIFDLMNGGPSLGQIFNIVNLKVYKNSNKKRLQQHKNNQNLIVIACGGDGTVGWVLSEIDKISYGQYTPAVFIMPLGTGNDLARTLNWGGSFNEEKVKEFLESVLDSSLVKLDR